MFDAAIIGAGPAGATLARLIGTRYKVLLIDRRPFGDAPRHLSARKCCGGLLAPDAQRMLSELGLGLPKSVLEGPQLFVVKAIDIQRGLERHYQRHYINMDRRAFDSWLLSMVPSGVDTRTGCRLKSYSPEDGSFRLTLRQGDRTCVEKARILIGADGASSAIRSQTAAAPSVPRRYVAIQEWAEAGCSQPYFTSIFDRNISDFYSWTIPKNAKAPQAAGVIHSDFERGFIRAEVIAYDDFVACKGEQGAKEAGKLRSEGKEYVVKDGDVVHFRFNV